MFEPSRQRLSEKSGAVSQYSSIISTQTTSRSNSSRVPIELADAEFARASSGRTIGGGPVDEACQRAPGQPVEVGILHQPRTDRESEATFFLADDLVGKKPLQPTLLEDVPVPHFLHWPAVSSRLTNALLAVVCPPLCYNAAVPTTFGRSLASARADEHAVDPKRRPSVFSGKPAPATPVLSSALTCASNSELKTLAAPIRILIG